MNNQDITRGLRGLARAVSVGGFMEVLREANLEYEDNAAVMAFAARVAVLLEAFDEDLEPEALAVAKQLGLASTFDRDRWLEAVAAGLETGDSNRCRDLLTDLGYRVAWIQEWSTPLVNLVGAATP
jgi:hypothetical protein